ncbi:MAG: glycoside hydrolase family 78 protein [Lachnospiraceae bacterium]|nr:glycoside hydrolase family 78 protein [Lachnospiraceae bacterium]
MTITNCKVNHVTNPLGYTMKRTVFSWTVMGVLGKEQTAARIIVKQGGKVVADTGFGQLDSLGTAVGIILRPRTRYIWTVTVQTDAAEEVTSKENWFETGKMDEAWQAEWIGCGDTPKRHPVFWRKISLKRDVISARLYICGLGLYEAAWNGVKIGEEYLAPYCNDYNTWVQYQTYDVTPQLKEGGVLSVTLGNGWYNGRFGYNEKNRKPYYGDGLKLLAELRICYADGEEEVVGTDESWGLFWSAVTFSNIYDGEHRDDTLLEDCLLDQAAVCMEASIVKPPKGALTERYSTPVSVREELTVKKIIHTPAGEIVLDLGQNLTGIFRLRVDVPYGQEVKLSFGEVLQNGNFYRDNLRSAKAEYIYKSAGKPVVLSPKFTFYGYRYVKVEGLLGIKAEDFTALVLYSDLQKLGTLVTGNDLVNRLILNVEWGQKGNFLDVPTDCPQRDERMGWTGDAQVFAPTASYFRDCYAFYAKYLHDMAQEQKGHEGEVPNVVPSFGTGFGDHWGSSAAWGDAACVIPWVCYEFSGDPSILQDQYDSMRGWVEFIRRVDGQDHGWRRHFHFGDWLALDSADPANLHGGTDVGYVADAMYYRSVLLLVKAAKVLGKTEDEEEYGELAGRVLNGIRKEYFTETGAFALATQTGLLLAVALGLSTDQKQVEEALIQRMEEDGKRLKTGFVGTPMLCPTLTAIGREDIAFALLLNEDYPGWLYEVKLGATTIWERWNSLLSDGSISDTGMNSLNHYAYGSIAEWLCRDVAGLSAAAPGFRKAVLAPHTCRELKNVAFTYQSAAGEWKVSWEILEEAKCDAKENKDLASGKASCYRVCYRLTVPFGCQARLVLPGEDERELAAGEYEFTFLQEEYAASH